MFSLMFKRIPGTKDILPDEADCWQEIEGISRSIFSLYNYREIRTPLLETSSLFDRSLGRSAEIVQKQMFLIKGKEDIFALRPEGTAGIVRSFLENNLDKTYGFSKFYYIGPMFRFERPQKGRLRQFQHIGCEAIGSLDAALDVEAVSLASNLLDAFSVKDYKIKINSLGCAKDKEGLASRLKKAFRSKLTALCQECRERFDRNVLRILDCKKEACRQAAEELGIGDSYLCPECKSHFSQVKKGLDSLKINYVITPQLVRGLDYYTRTVFEITHKALGAQDALGAGGRYDNLVKELGGPDLGAVGFAFGVERLLLVHSPQSTVHSKNLVYLITLGEEAKKEGLKLLDSLRKNGIACDTDYEGKSLKGALRKANDLGAGYVLMLGEDELKKGTVALKDMASGIQEEVSAVNLVQALKGKICLRPIAAVN